MNRTYIWDGEAGRWIKRSTGFCFSCAKKAAALIAHQLSTPVLITKLRRGEETNKYMYLSSGLIHGATKPDFFKPDQKPEFHG